MVKSRKIDAISQQLVISLLAATLFTALITSYLSIPAYSDEDRQYTASGHPVGMIPDKANAAGGEDDSVTVLADNMIIGNVFGIEATFSQAARIQQYNPVTHSKVSEFSVPCTADFIDTFCNGRGLADDGTNFWYSILSGGGDAEALPIYGFFLGDGLIHKIGMFGGADILTISDGYGAGGRGIGAIDIHPVTGNLWVSSYLPVNSTGMLDETCIFDDTGCVIEIKELTTTGTLVSRCDIPYENGGTAGIGNESLVVEAASGTFLTDGGEADLMFMDRYSLPLLAIPGTPCVHVADFDSPPIGIGGIVFDLVGNLVVSSTFAAGIGNLDGSPFDTLIGSTFSTDADIEDITIKSAPPGKIIIIKDTVPNNPQDFCFTTKGTGLNNFCLDDDGSSSNALSNTKMFNNLQSGSYTVSENPVADFSLTDIDCQDPNGGTSTSISTANINISNGETVTCKFTNRITPPPCINALLADTQPEDAISMTTTFAKVGQGQSQLKIAKTVHAEKQIFDCETTDGVGVIADLTIIAEIFEDMNTQSVIRKQVEVITCLKQNATAALVECAASFPAPDPIILQNCGEEPVLHPQEMNTITRNGNSIVKTIVAQKEVFLCDLDGFTRTNGQPTPCATTAPSTNPTCFDPEKKADLVLFTEIWEDLNNILNQTPPQFEELLCIIKIDIVTVESCKFREFRL